MIKPSIITLCGSSRFKDEFIETNRMLTLQGYVVLSICLSDKPLTESERRICDRVHRHKIDMSAAIMVINKDGYIGKSTREEIQYAKDHNKVIYYMEKI